MLSNPYVNTLLFGIYPYICLVVLLVCSLIRFDREPYTWKSDSSQMLRKRELRLGSNLFHYGVIVVILGHFAGFLAPHWAVDWALTPVAHQLLAMVVGGIAGLTAIVCVGEQRAERESGKTLDVVGGQLAGSLPDGATADNLVVAYEPVWAIGSGLTPTPADVAEVHAFIRKTLVARFGAAGEGVRILYGGSVKPSNAGELLTIADVNGALVGGASLKADDFLGIAGVYR